MIECQHCGSYRTVGEQLEENVWDYQCLDCLDYTLIRHSPNLVRAAQELERALDEIMP